MKKNIVALAIASAIAAPAAMAGAPAVPTVYGQVNMSVDKETDQGITVNSNSSRIGIKGASNLSNDLKVIYKMEWEVDVAGGNSEKTGSSVLQDRNAYVGLAGNFGAIILGRHDTPMKMSQPTDTFNDGSGDNKDVAGDLGFKKLGGELRAANAIAYVSPSFNGAKIVAASISPDNLGNDTSLANAFSFAAIYGSKKKGLYLAGAYSAFDKNVTGGKPGSESRFSAQYTTDQAMVNIMYQVFDKYVGIEGNNLQINASMNIGKLTPKIKFSSIDYASNTKKDGSVFGVGADYALAKRTTAYVEYLNFDKNVGNKDITSVGLRHKF